MRSDESVGVQGCLCRWQKRKEGGRKAWIKQLQKERKGEDKGEEVLREMEEERLKGGG